MVYTPLCLDGWVVLKIGIFSLFRQMSDFKNIKMYSIILSVHCH